MKHNAEVVGKIWAFM